MSSLIDTGPEQGTGRLTGDCLSSPVTNKLIPERGEASIFPKQMHKGLHRVATGQCLSATIALFPRNVMQM